MRLKQLQWLPNTAIQTKAFCVLIRSNRQFETMPYRSTSIASLLLVDGDGGAGSWSTSSAMMVSWLKSKQEVETWVSWPLASQAHLLGHPHTGHNLVWAELMQPWKTNTNIEWHQHGMPTFSPLQTPMWFTVNTAPHATVHTRAQTPKGISTTTNCVYIYNPWSILCWHFQNDNIENPMKKVMYFVIHANTLEKSSNSGLKK